jgi:protein-S-isoprenylcysteine O-methyltransferase Ste14
VPGLEATRSSRRLDVPFLAGWAGLAGFIVLEGTVRRRGAASSLAAGEEDRGTTRLIVAAYAVAGLAPPVLLALGARRLPRPVAWLGLGAEAAGLGLRAWSMTVLGSSYSRTLRTGESQGLVDDGPYGVVRHPGYLGSMLTWTGFALTSRSAPVVALTAALMARAYRDRIRAEEELLARELPGYAEYMQRTRRFIPFVW